MESGVFQSETSDFGPEVAISIHQSSKKYLLSMLLDSPLQNQELPKRYCNGNEEAAFSHEDSHRLHVPTEVPSSSESSASELMQLFSQAAHIESVKKSLEPNHESFSVANLDSELPIQSHKDLIKGRKAIGSELMPKRGYSMGSRCNCKMSRTSKKFHCNDISEDDRLAMFSTFWKKMDYNHRKKLISSLVKCSFPQKRRKLTLGLARKEFAFQYHLMKNAKLLRVCKVMFLSTFNLGEFAVRDWVMNKLFDDDA